jgi:hypothetical protein
MANDPAFRAIRLWCRRNGDIEALKDHLIAERRIEADDLGDLPMAKVAEMLKPAVQRRIGRTRENEKSKDQLVVSAFTRHHQLQPDGSIGNQEPATVRGMAKEYNLTTAAVSRFFQRKFKSKDAHKSYVATCNRGEIGLKLALWSGNMPAKHFADLLPHESGREADD